MTFPSEDLFSFFAEDSPARTYPWLETVLDWLGDDPDFGPSFIASLVNSLPPGFSSKTSMASFSARKGGTWRPSSGHWGTAGMGGPTGYLTLSIGEYPNGAEGSSLSDVLEVRDVPPKYFLSPKACRGILLRAARRGKTLPEPLEAALRAAATLAEEDSATTSTE